MSKRVLCAMSGGVDSSVAAALLIEQGYEVIGVTMKLWRGEDDPFAAHRFGGCCTVGSANDARSVAERLDIPYYVLNMQEEFERAVVDDFVAEYARGRTPNPCARCNEFIKFRAFLERADELNCDLIATGHYAQCLTEADGPHLKRGLDYKKDQSYVLAMLTRPELERTLFPVGGMEKSETRARAADLGLCVAAKPDSQEICFVEDGDYARFVTTRAPQMAQSGPIFDGTGRELGQHQGLAHYTVGQRKGLGLNSGSTPLFVTRIEAVSNSLIVGTREELGRDALSTERATWTRDVAPEGGRVQAQMRAHGRAFLATIERASEREFALRFDEPHEGVTPGQMCVLYDEAMGNDVIGQGTICG